MVTCLSCNGRWFWFNFPFQNIYLKQASSVVHNFKNHHNSNSHNCSAIFFKVNFEEGFRPPETFHGILTQRFWHPFKLFYCLIHFYMHSVQKIIIFHFQSSILKSMRIPWKLKTTVNICLFPYFNLTFYISQRQ